MRNLTSYLTAIESQLNELISNFDNQCFNERDIALIEVLQYVITISQDGEIKQLLDIIKRHFPEYGT